MKYLKVLLGQNAKIFNFMALCIVATESWRVKNKDPEIWISLG
jgi:hypothetical protein